MNHLESALDSLRLANRALSHAAEQIQVAKDKAEQPKVPPETAIADEVVRLLREQQGRTGETQVPRATSLDQDWIAQS